MSRQPIAYTVPQPLEPLNIEEVRFWLDIMQEHAVLIRLGLPCDRTDLLNEAQNFIREFDTLSNRAERVQSEKKFNELVNDARNAVCELHRFKRHLLRLKLTCKLAGWLFPSMLDHMAREAEYVMRLFDKMCEGRPALKAAAKTKETAFWVRIMGDHAKIMSHLLDPSERSLVATANEFGQDFNNLLLQSQDFASMLYYNDNEAPAFKRFLQDVGTSTRQLRNFKRAAQEMIAQCRLLGIIPELLADHVRREADHFLMILSMMEKGIITNITSIEPECEAVAAIEDIDEDECPDDDIDDDDCHYDCHYDCDNDRDEDDDDEDFCPEHTAKFEMYKSPSEEIDTMECETDEDDEDKEDDDLEVDCPICPPPSPPPCPPPVVEPVQQKPSPTKYKWGGKWPRPLGKS